MGKPKSNGRHHASPSIRLGRYIRPHTAARVTQAGNNAENDESTNSRPKTAGVLKQKPKASFTKHRGQNEEVDIPKKSPEHLNEISNDSAFISSEDNLETQNGGHNEPFLLTPSEGYRSLFTSTSNFTDREENKSNNAINRSILMAVPREQASRVSSIIQGDSEYDLTNEIDRKIHNAKFTDIAGAPTRLPLSMIGKCVRVRRTWTAWNEATKASNANDARPCETDSTDGNHENWKRILRSIRSHSSAGSEDYDTDLEEDFSTTDSDTPYDCTGLKVYKQLCRKKGLVPISYLLRHLGDRTITMKHHYMNTATVKTIAAALLSNTITEQVDFSDNCLDADAAHHIAEMLHFNSFISDLDLSNNCIQAEGMASIANMLKVNSSLGSLNLSCNRLVGHDISYLVDALKTNRKLHTLDLSGNDFCEWGGHFLGAMLVVSESLLNLDLSWSGIRCKASVAIASSLSKNDFLQVLDLSWNALGKAGADVLGKTLKDNVGLKVIDISHNGINDEGLEKIAAGIKKQDTLRTIILGHNAFGEKGCLALLKAIETHSNMCIVSLEEMKITVPVLERIKDVEQLGFYILHSGLRDYRLVCPELGMCQLLHQIIRREPQKLLSNFSRYDYDKTDWLPREFVCSSFIDAGFLLTNRLMRVLLGEIDAHMTDMIRYKELFYDQLPENYQYSPMMKHELFPPISMLPPRRLKKSLTFG